VLAVRAAVRRWLPHHLLTYILGRGLLGTLLASLLAALLVASHPLWGVGSEAVLVANLLMATDEASICGRLTPILGLCGHLLGTAVPPSATLHGGVRPRRWHQRPHGRARPREGQPGALQFIQARHEELAAFMATGHAKFTGEVGVCVATSGPGAIHLLNGLYDAKADHQPVLAIVGQQSRSALGGDYQQEVDLVSLFKDVAHEFVQMATVPEQVRHLVDRAMRIARDQRTVTCIILPSDLQELDAVPMPPHEHGTVHSGIGYTGVAVLPSQTAMQAAAEVLNSGQRVAILAGAGALHATDELIAVADTLGAGIAKALLGITAVPDDLPFVTGSIGLLGTQPSCELMKGCDRLLMVGSSFPYSEFLPPEGEARGVQIDLDSRRLSIRYPMEVNLVGDSRETLRALLPLLRQQLDPSWRRKIESDVAALASGAAGAGDERRPSDQSAAGVQRAVASAAGRLHPDLRFGHGGGLVRAPSAVPPRHVGLAVRRAGQHGPGAALCRGCQVGPSDAPGGGAARRRRDADDRHQQPDHHRPPMAAMGRPQAGRHGAEQRRPEHGHLGAAHQSGRPDVRGLAGCRHSPMPTMRGCWACTACAWSAPTKWAPPGTRPSPLTGRPCWRW
jgi:hypothetical protein